MRRYLLLRKEYEKEKEHDWRVERWGAWVNVGLSPYLKKKPHRPEDLLKLPSDIVRWVEKVEITDDIITALKGIGLIQSEDGLNR